MSDTHPTGRALIDTLDTLLDRERQALLDGALDDIGPMLVEKTALFARLAEVPPVDLEILRPLHLKLHRNQALFDHALAGIRNVADRLGTLRELRKSMDVYDAQGRRARIGQRDDNRLERRA